MVGPLGDDVLRRRFREGPGVGVVPTDDIQTPKFQLLFGFALGHCHEKNNQLSGHTFDFEILLNTKKSEKSKPGHMSQCTLVLDRTKQGMTDDISTFRVSGWNLPPRSPIISLLNDAWP